MKTSPTHKVAVLTGDIVGSMGLNTEERYQLFQTFPILSKLLQKRYSRQIKYEISNFRGDAWQLVVDQPQKSIEISLFIRTYLRYKFNKNLLDTRIAIGIGKVDFIPEENVSAGNGEAFILSGHLLDELQTSRMALDFTDPKDMMRVKCTRTIVELMDAIITPWGAGQCQAVHWALQGYTQNQIAEAWWPNPIRQPSVSKSLKTAGWDQIESALSNLEKLLEET